jgi:pyridoxal phosphate enzyme (YggS family)
MSDPGAARPADIAANLQAVRARIAAACRAAGRPAAEVELLAVSKMHPADAVRAAWAAGQRTFGENRVQELAGKARELRVLADAGLQWDLIGSLQTNKARDLLAVPGLRMVHSVDRAKLAEVLEAECARAGRELDVLLQINATGEEQKHGARPEEVAGLLQAARACPHLRVRGLMAMGPLDGDPAPAFTQVAALRQELLRSSTVELPVLSLGMTGDLEIAVAKGSTLVRVGTAVFGERS